jgi:hypothetical protein
LADSPATIAPVGFQGLPSASTGSVASTPATPASVAGGMPQGRTAPGCGSSSRTSRAGALPLRFQSTKLSVRATGFQFFGAELP